MNYADKYLGPPAREYSNDPGGYYQRKEDESCWWWEAWREAGLEHAPPAEVAWLLARATDAGDCGD
jgi:hypothetical protein